MFPLPFFFFPFFQVTMSQDRIVTCFHEYLMKKKKKNYEVLVLYIIAIVKIVAKCSIMVTNPNCGKHTSNKCYRKHISVLDEIIKEGKQKRRKMETASSSTESRNKSLISKTVGPINARKKALATALQVCHLLLQNLNPRINSINNWLNSLHEEGLGNLTEMI